MIPSPRTRLIAGTALLTGGLIFGPGLTLLKMSRTFSDLATSEVQRPPQAVAEGISRAMNWTSWGLAVAGLGVILIAWGCLSHFLANKRRGARE